MKIRKNVSEEYVHVLKRVDKSDLSDSGSETSEVSAGSNYSFPRYSQRKNLADMKDKILGLAVKGSAAPAALKTPREGDHNDDTSRFPRIGKTRSIDGATAHQSQSGSSSRSYDTSPKKAVNVIVPQLSYDCDSRVASDSSKILFAEPDLSDL